LADFVFKFLRFQCKDQICDTIPYKAQKWYWKQKLKGAKYSSAFGMQPKPQQTKSSVSAKNPKFNWLHFSQKLNSETQIANLFQNASK
jgi:hypothetical protein